MPSNALYRTPEGVMNALSGPQGPLGMNPNVNRLSLLPRYNQREGLVAPQWLYDLARAAEAPGNALMGHQTSPEEAFNFAGNVAGAGLGSSAMMRNPAPGPGRTIAQTVYHGSPHDFDKFDMSKIGTGEGAQAYGHGLYVAESPGVAKQYAATLGRVGASDAAGNRYGRYELASFFSEKLQASGIPRQAADSQSLLWADKFAKGEQLSHPIASDVIASKRLTPANGGTTYTVDLPDSHIANMLDWDAPLSQQPESVRKALERGYREMGMDSAALSKTPKTGREIYQDFVVGMGGLETKDASKASSYLGELGIPGIKYLDGGSRAAGNGTRNYVVFDDKLLKILNKE